MLCIRSNHTDPYYNLAAEEYLLRNSGREICMLWQSKPSVIVGKHQNTYAEISYRYALKNNIVIARRLTGGGAVFHDMGNVNFSFITTGESDKLVDFQKHIKPILEFLRSYGIDAHSGSKNEILAGGRKISGNAEHIFKDRVLHHGTLLFSTDLHALHEVITGSSGVYKDKAVKSNRSNVINLTEFLPGETTIDSFVHDLNNFLLNFFSGEPYAIQEDEDKEIQNLSRSKYEAWEWIYGWSPDYEFSNHIEIGNFKAVVRIQTQKSIIMAFSVESEFLPARKIMHLVRAFQNAPHTYETVETILKDQGMQDVIPKENWDDLVFGFF
ncbi:MAG: lipoate--protein ligase [Bacteroidales bacterium]|nr:lipoate--protein ligase [Bacteroidales bacterium]